MRTKQRHKTVFKEVSRPGGRDPIISTREHLQYLHMKDQFNNEGLNESIRLAIKCLKNEKP